MKDHPLLQASAAKTQAKQQFGLSAAFYLMAVYAAGLPFGLWTVVLTTLVLGAWWVFFKLQNRGWLIAVILFLVYLLILVVPFVRVIHEATLRRTAGLHEVGQLTLAIINYESRRGAFPPAYDSDDAGKPIHSWRVLMLPSIGEDALYAKYDFDEPWDGPNNIKLLDQMPAILSCRIKNSSAISTPYKLVVDEGTLFEGGQTFDYGSINDGSLNTFAVIEDLKNPVPWTKPEDLTIEQAVALLGERRPSDVSRISNTQFTSTLYGPSVSFFDGSTLSVGAHVDPNLIRDFCTHDDGRVVDKQMLGGPVTVLRWDRYAALIAYIILLIVPGLVALKRAIANRHR